VYPYRKIYISYSNFENITGTNGVIFNIQKAKEFIQYLDNPKISYKKIKIDSWVNNDNNENYGTIFNPTDRNSDGFKKNYTIYIYNNKFSNTFGYRGGVIYSSDDTSILPYEFHNNTFRNNYAEEGIYFSFDI